jgi:hypothetical protein
MRTKKKGENMRVQYFCFIFLSCFVAVGANTVSGTITDYINREPVDSCILTLECFSPHAINDTIISDNNGKYSFDSLPAGVYSLKTYHKNFIADTVNLVLESDQIIPFILLNRSHVLDSVPDTLYKEGSPYLVTNSIRTNKPLVILPDVTILFLDDGDLRFNSNISAIGTEQDSIRFIADSSSCTDTFYNPRSGLWLDKYNYQFKYCRFDRLNSIMISNFSHLSFENNLFTRMYTALTFCRSNITETRISNNTIIGCIDGIRGYYPYFNPSEDINVTMENNMIYCSNIALTLAATDKIYVNHNTIIGQTNIDLKKLSDNDTVINNIFSGIYFNGQPATIPYIAYNTYDTLSGSLPPGVGKKVLTNGHGDSCDFFYNIRTNPHITDSISGMIAQTSPCAGTASDGKNMGVYQGSFSAPVRDKHNEMENHSSVLLKMFSGTYTIFIPLNTKQLLTSGKFKIELFSINGKCIAKFDNQLIANINGLFVINSNLLENSRIGNYIIRISNHNTSLSVPICFLR